MENKMDSEELKMLAKAKEFPIVDYLEKAGYKPVRDSNAYALYSSPLRVDRNPSFVVNKKKNLWNDYGRDNQYGDLIDLVREMEGIGIIRAVKTILSGRRAERSSKIKEIEEEVENVIIHEKKPIESWGLIRYVYSRGISLDLARKYLWELHVSFRKGKYPNLKYTVLGFENDSKGFELRSEHFKLSKSPKNISTFKGNETIAIFEGFFDFLSALTHFKADKLKETVVVLNSLSFLRGILPFFEGREKLLFLDNDKAADKIIKSLTEEDQCKDMRDAYKGYNDFNDMIRNDGVRKPIR